HVLVVGAGTQPSDEHDAPMGNGRAIAILAAREGASVTCVDRDVESANDTASRIKEQHGTATVIEADVTDETACIALVEQAAAAPNGPIDALVLNVGIGRGAGLARTSTQDWDTTFAVNLRSHFIITREALPRMSEQGAIVFISSVAGLQPGSRLPAYD